MTNYEEESRGTYQNRDYARQIVSFEGMKFIGSTGVQNVTPTDIDGYIQLDNQDAFIFFELKHGEPKLPSGQAKAMTRLVDALSDAGKNSILFIAWHNSDKDEDVIAADAIVDRVYKDKRWERSPENVQISLNECISNYLRRVVNEKN